MTRVFARKTIGWIGHGDWYTFMLTRDGWKFEVGTKAAPAPIAKMVESWPTLAEAHALNAAIGAGDVKASTGTTVDEILKAAASA